MPPRSPLAPDGFPDLPVVGGVRLAAAAAGVRGGGRDVAGGAARLDVMLAVMDPGTTIAGTLTRSSTRSAAVRDCEAKLAGPQSRDGAAFLVNSGNSNAFTGARGEGAVRSICELAAEALEIPTSRILTASTGVIGEPLPWERVTAVLPALRDALSATAVESAARAIMTTDTYPKGAGATVALPGGPVRIAGIAKGSGMIAPDMGTMIVHVFTDARVARSPLQAMVAAGCERTFNRITVDGDTSTSDTLLVAATGASGVDGDHPDFAAALEAVFLDLALQVVRDGEGATKLVEVAVTGAASDADAKRVALSIANSPLVKTAIAGEDANWGRVVMAVGKSGAEADRDRLSIRFGDVTVARDGVRAPDYSEEAASAYMRNAELVVGVDLGLGPGAATVWTCDLTHGYIDINADYRS